MAIDPTSVADTILTHWSDISDLIRSLHTAAQPDAPALTNEDVLNAFHQVVASSLAKDDAWMAAHPDPSTPEP